MKYINGIFLLSVSAAVQASEHPVPLQQSVEQAITRFEQTQREHWAYRIERYENEEGEITSSVEIHDPKPGTSQSWFLLKQNGEDATDKQRKKFAKRKAEQAKEKGKSYSIKLRDLIVPDSLQLVSESANSIQASFDVYLDRLGEDASKSLQGSLWLSKQDDFIEQIQITNREPFSPLFSATINEFTLSMDFINIDDAILPNQQNLQMKGTFAFFTEIDEVSKDTFSAYQYVGPLD